MVDSNDFHVMSCHVMAWQEAFRDHGHFIERGRIRAQIGKGADQLIPALLPEAGDASEKKIGRRHGEIFKPDTLKQ